MQPWSEEFDAAVRASLLHSDADLHLATTTSLTSLQLDSLGVMALVTSLEQSLKTTLPPDALAKGFDTTLGDLWSYCVGTQTCTTTS